MIIRFQGKDLNLRLTYKSIHFLELAFDQDYASFIAEQTPFNQSLYIFWAMLQNEADYEGVSVLDVAELLQDSLDSYEFTLEEYFDKVNSSYASSILVKQLFKTTQAHYPEEAEDKDELPKLDVRYFMVLCTDLGIPSSDFWTSTPYEFNGMLRGAYQRQSREASLFLSLVQSKKPVKLEKYQGFELVNETNKPKTTRDMMETMDELDRAAFKEEELSNLFDYFD